jgi:hypothetical protein
VTEPKINPQRALQLWILAVVLVVSGVLLARLIRAALKPVLRLPDSGLELHLVNAHGITPSGRGSAFLLRTKDPLQSLGPLRS